jgi:hypothetical protein
MGRDAVGQVYPKDQLNGVVYESISNQKLKSNFIL